MVQLHSAVETWLSELDQETYELGAAAIDLLKSEGPNLRRPLVGEIQASRHKNMKELRPGSSGEAKVRILFAFDLSRMAVLLVAGDKSGQWDRWYRENIPIADRRLDERIAEIKESTTVSKKTKKAKKGKRNG